MIKHENISVKDFRKVVEFVRTLLPYRNIESTFTIPGSNHPYYITLKVPITEKLLRDALYDGGLYDNRT